jgi:hypothetical protein
MEHLMIDASPAQIRKLRKGEKVRVKKGCGFNLLVRPETLGRVSKTFAKNKGVELSLMQDEIDANTVVSPEQHAQLQRVNPEGRGIFGKKFDKFMNDKLGKDVYGKIYKGADTLKPAVKAGVKSGLTALGTAATPMVATYAPMLAPFIPAAVSGASMLADDYIDDPDKYQKPFRTGLKGRKPRNIKEQAQFVNEDEMMNHKFGTNYNYMGRAGMQQALANTMRKKMNDEQIISRANLIPRNMSSGPKRGSMDDVFYAPEPMTGPSSYERSMGMTGSGLDREGGIIGLKGGMIHPFTPQAMESQPFGANFQMQYFLPPQFHKYNSGTTAEGMTGTGVKSAHAMNHLPPALQSQPMGANFMMKNFLPVQFQEFYQANPIMVGQGLGVGLYAGKGLYV